VAADIRENRERARGDELSAASFAAACARGTTERRRRPSAAGSIADAEAGSESARYSALVLVLFGAGFTN